MRELKQHTGCLVLSVLPVCCKQLPFKGLIKFSDSDSSPHRKLENSSLAATSEKALCFPASVLCQWAVVPIGSASFNRMLSWAPQTRQCFGPLGLHKCRRHKRERRPGFRESGRKELFTHCDHLLGFWSGSGNYYLYRWVN